MKTETQITAQIHNFPSGLVRTIKDNPDWEKVRVAYDPHPDGQADYEIRYKGRCILRFSNWNGYGFGADATYPIMNLSDFNLLKSVYANHCRVWKVLTNETN